MRIWLDMNNSPHPLLFRAIAERLRERGDEILVTARDTAQTRELTLSRWPEAEIIGAPTQASRWRKATLIAERVNALRHWAKNRELDMALSHNSYAQVLAARLLGIRAITAMDYEYQPANHVAFRAAHRVILPRVFSPRIARLQGASARKARYHQGLKEEIYLGDFEPNDNVLRELGIPERNGRTLVVARTPPTGATYHRFGNPQFERLVDQVQAREDCLCVVLPRSPEQGRAFSGNRSGGLVVPGAAVDSRSLLYGADLFLGAGGTMTREAALLGTPTVSVYLGRRAAADIELARRGRLRILEPGEVLGKILPRTKTLPDLDALRRRASEVTDSFVAAVLD
jgi:predicted glycosyltransferase